MNLLGLKSVKVGDKEFPIMLTNRAMIEYEALSGSSVVSFQSTKELIQFFYCTAKAGAKKTGKEFTYTYDEFLDVIDEFYLDTITNFSEAITEPGGEEKKLMESSI
jgi:hypothetical protein